MTLTKATLVPRLAAPSRMLATQSGDTGKRAPAIKKTDSEPKMMLANRQDSSKVAILKSRRFPDFEAAARARGTGGRHSFCGITATVLNGTSRLGREVISQLGAIGAQVIIGYRGERYFSEKLRNAGDLGQIYYAPYSFKDDYSLYEAVRYSNVVINTTGKETETRQFPFNEIHCEGPRRLARIARECGVNKFIHVSALNASPKPEPKLLKNGSGFLKSKYDGEVAVREEFPDATIFRPADILGEHDDLLHHYTGYGRCRYSTKLALWDYYDGVQKQPVFRGDFSKAMINAILDDSSSGQTYQAIGPYRYDFYSLIEYMRACSGRGQKNDRCQIINLRWDFLMRAFIRVQNILLKYPLVSWDRIERDLTSDYIDPDLPTLEDLGVKLTPLEVIIPKYAHYIPRTNRVEIPYTAREIIPPPNRLNLSL